MKKIFLCPLLLFIVSNAQAQDQCQEQYTYSCSVVSDPSEEERQQGITTGGEWIKCVPVDEKYPVPEATVTTSSENNTATTDNNASEDLSCTYNPSTKWTSCSGKRDKVTPLLVLGSGMGVGIDMKTLSETKRSIYSYTPQITIGMRLQQQDRANFDFGACYNVGLKNSDGVNQGSAFGIYIMSDNSISLNAMFGKDQNKKISFKSAELAIKFPFNVKRVYFSPKLYVNYFKSYCVDVLNETYKKDGFVVGVGLDINVAVLGLTKQKHVPGGCAAGWYREIEKKRKRR